MITINIWPIYTWIDSNRRLILKQYMDLSFCDNQTIYYIRNRSFQNRSKLTCRFLYVNFISFDWPIKIKGVFAVLVAFENLLIRWSIWLTNQDNLCSFYPDWSIKRYLLWRVNFRTNFCMSKRREKCAFP